MSIKDYLLALGVVAVVALGAVGYQKSVEESSSKGGTSVGLDITPEAYQEVLDKYGMVQGEYVADEEKGLYCSAGDPSACVNPKVMENYMIDVIKASNLAELEKKKK